MPSGKIFFGDKIRFKANPLFKDEDVVKAVARIVLNTEVFSVQPSGSGYKWMLGASNDWWMDKDPETGEFILAWRNCGGANIVYMQLLYHVILWRLGIVHFNEEAKAEMSRCERLKWLKLYFTGFLAEFLHPYPFGFKTRTQFDSDVLDVLDALEEKYKKE
mgnify:CR=1 FL=1